MASASMTGSEWCSSDRSEEERREETNERKTRRREEWKGDEGEVRDGMRPAGRRIDIRTA